MLSGRRVAFNILLLGAVACGGAAEQGPGGTAQVKEDGSAGAASDRTGPAPASSAGQGASGGPSSNPEKPSAASGGRSGSAGEGATHAGTSGTAGTAGTVTCQDHGKTYRLNERFAVECNNCSCTARGISCTAIACSNACTYAGQSHPPFEVFPSRDGCNQCNCGWTGAVCTQDACACTPDKEWWRYYASRSADTCKELDYACPANTKPFSNDCGCGCEENSECGEWVDCSPGVSSCEGMKLSCPYAKVAD